MSAERNPAGPAAGAAEAKACEPVSVNGVRITEEEIAREIQHHPAPSLDEARRQAASALVVRELLLQEARRRGRCEETPPASSVAPSAGTSPSAAVDGGAASEKPGFERAIERLLLAEVDVPEPDVEVCRRYYERNKERFRSPDVFVASHILLPAEPDDEEARTLAKATAWALLRELDVKPGGFADLAREHSACSSASEGGLLGQITKGQTAPEFEAALARLAPGDHTREPVSTRYGYHIIKLHRRVDGRQLPFSLAQKDIAEYLRSRSWNQAVHQYISILIGQSDIRGIDLEGAMSPLVQ